jgi:hypothetical protein
VYYRDLTRPEEGASYYQPNAFYIGWLDPDEEEPRRGFTAPEFQDRLAAMCVYANHAESHRGPHMCPFCTSKPASGSTTFLVEHTGGVRYYFPELIAHYVMAHGYKPPQEFIDAVMANER